MSSHEFKRLEVLAIDAQIKWADDMRAFAEITKKITKLAKNGDAAAHEWLSRHKAFIEFLRESVAILRVLEGVVPQPKRHQ